MEQVPLWRTRKMRSNLWKNRFILSTPAQLRLVWTANIWERLWQPLVMLRIYWATKLRISMVLTSIESCPIPCKSSIMFCFKIGRKSVHGLILVNIEVFLESLDNMYASQLRFIWSQFSEWTKSMLLGAYLKIMTKISWNTITILRFLGRMNWRQWKWN